MNKIKNLKNIIEANSGKDIQKELLKLFNEQVEETTAWIHLTLTKEQYEALGKDFDFKVFGDILISVEEIGLVNFVHCFYLENIDSIKEQGLLVSYSSKDPEYVPDMGYGIYVEEGSNAYEISDELASFLVNRYDGEDSEIGYVEGTFNGKYLKCIYGYEHEGYIVLKEDVTLDMINNISSEYISALARNYWECEVMDFDF